MPPTCLGTTHPDNGIVCPILQQFLTKIEVLPQDTFATHSPVIVTLQTEVPQPLRPRLPMPKTYLDFQVTEAELQEVVSTLPQQTSTLEQWGETIEQLVDCAMQQRHDQGAVRQLPRAYRGRCKPREPVNMPYATSARSSRKGEYTPEHEITNFGAKKRLKQLRRMQSLLQQIKAHEKDDQERWFRTRGHLYQEWVTLLQSRAFGLPFYMWLEYHPELGPPPFPVPSYEWLHSAIQFVKYEFERHVAADRLLQKRLDKLDRLEDQKKGSKKHFAYIKHDTKPPLHALALPVDMHCQATWDIANMRVVLALQPEDVHVGSPIFVEQHKGWVVSTIDESVADSIFGVSQSMSPALALLLGTKQILDPEFQLIVRAVRAARRWLDSATYQHRRSFYELAASFQGGLLKVRGPASALSHYLAPLNWWLEPDGTLQGGYVQLHILDDSFARIKMWLSLAWQNGLAYRLTDRKHIHDFPDISRCETVALLNQLDPAERGHIVRAIAGGYQTQHQKCQWDHEASESCQFCTQPDSYQHRMFECPAFSDERIPFADTIKWCQCNANYLAELPAVLCHHDEEAHRLMQFHEPEPVVPSAFMQEATRRRDADIPLCLFTDGSCTEPTCPSTRRAGYAVVMDLCDTKEQRDLFATSFLDTGNIPPCFQVVAVGRVRGEQTIGRAEPVALEIVTRFPGQVITAADSQYAMNQVQYIKHQTFRYLQGSHVDVATRIANQLHPGHHFVKVKSRQVATRDMPLDQVFQIMGNTVADEAAKSATAATRDDFNTSLQARHDAVQAHRFHVRRLYDLMLQLQRARQRLESGQAATISSQQQQALANLASNRDIIMHFAPEKVIQQCVSDWGQEHYEFFAWGPELATSFEKWFCQLQWNDGGCIPPCCNTGVTWLELAVSFSRFRKQCLPVIRDSAEGQKKLLLISDIAHCHIHSVTLGDLAKTMQLMWSHFLFFVHPNHHPETGRGLCKSLVWLGFLQHSSGLLRRPVFFEQAPVVTYLEQVLDNKNSFDVPFRPTWIESSHSAQTVTEEQQWGLVQWLTSGASLDWFSQLGAVAALRSTLPEWGPKRGPLLDDPPAGCSDVGHKDDLGPFFGRISLIRTPPGSEPQKHHRDINFPGPAAQVTAQAATHVALTQLEANNGPLAYVPGSHRMVMPGFEVVANPPLGSVVLYDSFCEHRGIEHHGNKDRRSRAIPTVRYAMYYEFETRGVFSGYTANHFGPSSAKHMKDRNAAVGEELGGLAFVVAEEGL
eukprot:Skav224953  [mRNA]  locus=scaffold1186:122876:133880:+ [translate_table: standard]